MIHSKLNYERTAKPRLDQDLPTLNWGCTNTNFTPYFPTERKKRE